MVVSTRLICLSAVLQLARIVDAGAPSSNGEFEKMMSQLSNVSKNLTERRALQIQRPPSPPSRPQSDSGTTLDQQVAQLRDQLDAIENHLQQYLYQQMNIMPKNLDSLVRALKKQGDLWTNAGNHLQHEISELKKRFTS